MSVLGFLILILGILASIALHELGHLTPAKLFGVYVPQYFIGFGKTLWSTVRGDTEYGVKAIPLGGFVRLGGMFPPTGGGRQTNRHGQPTLAAEARRASAEDVKGREDEAFYLLSVPKKLTVMFGGPAMNLVIAVVLAIILIAGIGAPTYLNKVGTLAPCDGQVCAEGEASPAEAGGLKVGDEILAWGGQEASDWNDVREAIAAGSASPTEVRVLRDGAELTLNITPVLATRPVLDSSGQVVTENGTAVTREIPYVGVGPEVGLEPGTAADAIPYLGDMLWRTAGIIIRLPMKLFQLTDDFIHGDERAPDSIVGLVGVAQVAGQITGADIEGYTALERTADLLNLLIALNISLFAFNLLPLLPLDGGHIAGALWEGLRRSWARLRGRPDPGPVDTARLMPLSYAVALAFIAMTLLLIVVDIVNPVTLR
ncbi:MAG: site-2 protease family protein [Flaviflexus sp.]|nr:site-2 protease family protein [Flaviflexus sp.]